VRRRHGSGSGLSSRIAWTVPFGVDERGVLAVRGQRRVLVAGQRGQAERGDEVVEDRGGAGEQALPRGLDVGALAGERLLARAEADGVGGRDRGGGGGQVGAPERMGLALRGERCQPWPRIAGDAEAARGRLAGHRLDMGGEGRVAGRGELAVVARDERVLVGV
jgi:hypothetical protein